VLSGFNAKAPGKKGIHIGGHSGQPVKAAANGKVVYVGSGLVGYGRLIIIKHNDNLLSAYGHNSKLLVVEGDHVKIGQTIATMGSSGTDRTALYFEVRENGKPINPLRYLPKGG
jgi:lipoprotein NlpD